MKTNFGLCLFPIFFKPSLYIEFEQNSDKIQTGKTFINTIIQTVNLK